jgi:RNA polymerase sigma factor (sigma-70 family)
MTDHDIHLAAIAAGDAARFGRWAAASEQRLRLSLSRFAASVDVEAVLQETLLVVWQVAPKIEPDGRPNSLLRFAIRSARNRAIDQLRRQGREHSVAHVQEQYDEALDHNDEPDPLLRSLVADCHEKLPNKPGLALNARLSPEAPKPDRLLAAELKMTLNTFLQNVGRARRLLARCLESQGVRIKHSKAKA